MEGQGGYAKELALLRLSVSEEVGLLRNDVARLSEEVKKYNAKYLGQADDYRRTQGELALCKAESGRFEDEMRAEMRKNLDEMDERLRRASGSGVQANLDRAFLQDALEDGDGQPQIIGRGFGGRTHRAGEGCGKRNAPTG